MAKKPKQKLKLLRIRDALLENTDEEHVMSVAAIAEYLAKYGIEAERKSIYEDIEELKYYGMDIVTVKGKGGGYFVGSREFETAQLKLLVDAVQASRFITRSKSRELINSISSLAGKYDRAKLSRQVHIPERVKSMNESIYYSIDYIHNAINENKKITFKYFEWNSKKEKIERHGGRLYKVSPWHLIWDDENYYLAAYDSDAEIIKHYRVDKMRSIAVTDEMREGEESAGKVDVDAYSTAMFGMFGGEMQYVRLKCEERFAGAIIDRFGKDVFMIPFDGGFFADVKVSVSPRFFAWLMGFGGGMKLVSPLDVVEKMKECVLELYNMYEEE